MIVISIVSSKIIIEIFIQWNDLNQARARGRCREGYAFMWYAAEYLLSHGARLRHEWQKGLTAFRRPFKPPRRGPTPDRKRQPADRPTDQQTGRPADQQTGRPGVGWRHSRTARPSSSRASKRACSIDPLGRAKGRNHARRNSRRERNALVSKRRYR